MLELFLIALVAWGAGLAAFAGGVAARLEGSADTVVKNELVHGIVAFGGGILIGAVAFSLAPHAMAALPTWLLALTFAGGGVGFAVVDWWISRQGGSKAQFLAMLLDFVPEAMALGALFGQSRREGILLAVFIAAQNLPEGFNAFRETVQGKTPAGRALWVLLAVSFLGPLAALGGYLFLQHRELLTAAIMSTASGGILYLLFQDIAPEAKLTRRWSPPLGAVLGFLVAMVGKQLLG